MSKKIIAVVGARPQFIKNAPLEMAFKNQTEIEFQSIHTGQHYDDNMSQIFFEELGMNTPTHQLKIGSASHGKQTGQMLDAIESILLAEKPDLLIVYGDTNSTLAGALAAAKLHIPIAHIEAGLRSYNREMPEELNRVLTDHLSSLLFVPSEVAVSNLKKEGITKGVEIVGDIMLDSLNIALSRQAPTPNLKNNYYYATIHRPYNTDSKDRITEILDVLDNLSLPVVFSIHPRTSNLLNSMNVDLKKFNNIHFIEPQGYFDNVAYMKHATRIITDSGGLQKEAWFLKKPCVTIRPETEWVETLNNNWNILIFDQLQTIKTSIEIEPGGYNEGVYGYGNTASDILYKIAEFLAAR